MDGCGCGEGAGVLCDVGGCHGSVLRYHVCTYVDAWRSMANIDLSRRTVRDQDTYLGLEQ